MKKSVLFFFFSFSVLFSFSQWTPIISGTTDDLVDGFFTSDSVGYVISKNGTVLKTTDYGNSWVQKTTLPGTYKAICWAGTDTIYAAGNTLYKSVNGGNTWSYVATFTNTASDLLFFGSKYGFVIFPGATSSCSWGPSNYSSTVFNMQQTIDNGSTWQNVSGYFDNTSRFQLINDSSAIVPGTNVYYGIHCYTTLSNQNRRTKNRGQSWSGFGNPFFMYFNKIYYLNDTTGFYLNNAALNSIFKTTNAGTNFTSSYTEILDTNFTQCLFTNDIDGYTIGNKYIYETRSAGLRWNKDHTSLQTLNNIFRSKKTLITIGNSGLILKKVIVNSTVPENVYRITNTTKSINYGSIEVDSLSVVTMTITNTGNLPLNLSLSTSLMNFEISPGTSSYQNTLSVSLAPFQTQQVNVLFNPKSNISYDDSLVIYDSNIGAVKIPLAGVGFYGLRGNLTKDTLICTDTINVGGNVTIKNGVKVTICPGTVLKFLGDFKILVNGALRAIGNSTASISFVRKDTTKFWNGVEINNLNYNDSTIFNYCIMKEACSAPLIKVDNGFVNIRNSILRNTKSGNYCISTYPAGICRLTIQNNTIYDTKYSAISIDNSKDSVFIIKNRIYGNNGGIEAYGGNPIYYKTITVFGNQIYNNGYGLLMRVSSVIDSNSVFNNKGNALEVQGASVTIKNNRIYNNKGNGILAYTGADCYIIQNLIFNNQSWVNGAGLEIAPYSWGGLVYVINNTICNNKNTLLNAADDFYATPNTTYPLYVLLLNNIIYNVAGNGMSWNSTLTYSIDYNCIPSVSGVSPNNIVANPLFIAPTDSMGVMLNLGGYDWNIQGGSPCINSGATLTSGLTPVRDINGWGRLNGVIDMGAFEFSPVGIKEQEALSRFKIFPNPAKDVFFLMGNNISEIKTVLYDVSGRKIYCNQQNYNDLIKFNTENLESGVYFLEVSLGTAKGIYKIIKQ